MSQERMSQEQMSQEQMSQIEPAVTGAAATAKRAASAAVLIASTRAATGAYQDLTGPVIADWLREHNLDVSEPVVVPDGPSVGSALKGLLLQGHTVIITSGGTGISPSDVTPEMTLPLLEKQLPGVMEAMRAAGLQKTPKAALSRGYAGSIGSTFIVNLPGSPGGVSDGLGALDQLLPHIIEQLTGGHGHG